MHFAAHTIVPESVVESAQVLRQQHLRHAQPARVLRRAGCRALRFLVDRRGLRHSVRRSRREDSPTPPINPYGSSKLMSEWMLRDLAAASSMRYVALRYFNVAGMRSERPHRPVDAECHAAGQGGLRAGGWRATARVSVFGTDYPTPDGTGVRDYIHVEDLAGRAPQRARLSAGRRRIDDAQLRLRTRLLRARGARARLSA